MSADLSTHARDAAFAAYACAYSGAPFYSLPVAEGVDPCVIAAAILAGTADRGGEPASRAEVEAYVTEALRESREGPGAGEVAEPPDATADALAAYAEGYGDALTDLETWEGGPIETGAPANVRQWIAARRAAAPRRPMTAGDLLQRLDDWDRDKADLDVECPDMQSILAKVRREIAAR